VERGIGPDLVQRRIVVEDVTRGHSSVKNEHIVWAHAEREDGNGQIVVIGLTEQGLKYLSDSPGQTLLANPPGKGFANVTQIVIFHEKDKATLKERFREAGVAVSEVN
jgi:hypothetical protein